MKIAGWGLAMLLFLPAGLALAQDQPAQPQEVSPAEAARRAREEKQSQPKATKVWDNDNLPNTPRGVNVVGQEPAATDESAATGEAGAGEQAGAPAAPKTAGQSAESAASNASAISSVKAKLESLKADLESQRRKYDLDSQMYYSNPNPATDKAGADKLADEQSQINAKQQEIEEQQKALESLESQATAPKAGAEAGGGPTEDTGKPNPNGPSIN